MKEKKETKKEKKKKSQQIRKKQQPEHQQTEQHTATNTYADSINGALGVESSSSPPPSSPCNRREGTDPVAVTDRPPHKSVFPSFLVCPRPAPAIAAIAAALLMALFRTC